MQCLDYPQHTPRSLGSPDANLYNGQIPSYPTQSRSLDFMPLGLGSLGCLDIVVSFLGGLSE